MHIIYAIYYILKNCKSVVCKCVKNLKIRSGYPKSSCDAIKFH